MDFAVNQVTGFNDKASLPKQRYTAKASVLKYAANSQYCDYTEQQYMACTFSIPMQVEVQGKMDFVVATVEEDFEEFYKDLRRIFRLPKTSHSVKVQWDKDSSLGDLALGADNLSATLRFMKTRAPKVDKLVIESM